jgi:hypothetical protein
MIQGVLGRPFLDLEPLLDGDVLEGLAAVHEEVCLGLAEVPSDFTGGSHRSMGIMPASRLAEAHVDYGEVIASLDGAGYAAFRALADDPASLPVVPAAGRFGEERDHPLSRRQMLWLQYRHGVYFPWKVYVEMIPNRSWDEKSTAVGKDFTRLARTFFPRTVALVERLPFSEIGRCNIMGLLPNDHGTVHRDGVPDEKPDVDHFITLCPQPGKRLFLWDEEAGVRHDVRGRAYWFNDSDWHGVEAAEAFQYSLRVDGVFRPEFMERLLRATEGAT